jgi:DNA-binding transcriptional LysR family regulator
MKPSATVLLQRLLNRGKFRHVQVLLKLAELGSLKRAADAMGMTQSAATQTLAYLEQLLEVELFERHSKGVRPTPVCDDLLPVARQLFQGLTHSAEVLSIHQDNGQQTVRLAASAAAINGLLVNSLVSLSQAVTGIKVILSELEGTDQLMAIARKEIDMSACRRPIETPEAWCFTPLMLDRIVIVCGPSHPLLKYKTPDKKKLAQCEWLLMPAGSAARESFDRFMGPYVPTLKTFPLITRVLTPIATLLQERELLCQIPLSVVKHLVDRGELKILLCPEDDHLEPLGLLTPVKNPRKSVLQLTEFLLQRTQ